MKKYSLKVGVIPTVELMLMVDSGIVFWAGKKEDCGDWEVRAVELMVLSICVDGCGGCGARVRGVDVAAGPTVVSLTEGCGAATQQKPANFPLLHS